MSSNGQTLKSQFECNTAGCNDVTIVNPNPFSAINVACNDIFSCYNMNLTTYGNLTMDCNVGSSCKDMIIGIPQVLFSTNSPAIINCNDSGSCHAMCINTVGYLSINCQTMESCQYSNVTARERLIVTCQDAYSCSNMSLSGDGNLTINCNVGHSQGGGDVAIAILG